MTVELLHHTPLSVGIKAIRTCWNSERDGYIVSTDNISDKDKELMYRVGNKNKHSSTLEHIQYSFKIEGISRACLQELARHRHASLSVKSSRYTLKELKTEGCFTLNTQAAKKYVVLAGESTIVDDEIIKMLETLRLTILSGASNDIAKYLLPEAYKTDLVWSINMRSLQNFLNLRTGKAALKEIQDLARTIFKALPAEHKFMLEEFVHG